MVNADADCAWAGVPDRVRNRFLADSEERVLNDGRDRKLPGLALGLDPYRPVLNDPLRAGAKRGKKSDRSERGGTKTGDAAPGLFVAVPHQLHGEVDLLLEGGRSRGDVVANRLKLVPDSGEAL